MEIRPTTRRDIAAVDALLAASYPVLLKADYPPSVLVTALPLISRAQPKLVTCGTYYGVFEGQTLVGAGGWTMAAPGGAQSRAKAAHIRHVVTDHRRVREGVGRLLMAHIFAKAAEAGVNFLACQSTLTAAPYYRAMGFEGEQVISVPLRAGIDFPAVSMGRALP
ncbi:GNAT family N-acetyltransferase [uncultured Litoreibacter sp.]|uniref:GNAT family N-acetyltransferase n=1 Tax=uncultured Litoreibacter sp. TaxID=1392394 RepID=UPI002607287B|nr:GNAT family N-acetyltransferase [uncultured Litoreibacter sp.]